MGIDKVHMLKNMCYIEAIGAVLARNYLAKCSKELYLLNVPTFKRSLQKEVWHTVDNGKISGGDAV